MNFQSLKLFLQSFLETLRYSETTSIWYDSKLSSKDSNYMMNSWCFDSTWAQKLGHEEEKTNGITYICVKYSKFCGLSVVEYCIFKTSIVYGAKHLFARHL